MNKKTINKTVSIFILIVISLWLVFGFIAFIYSLKCFKYNSTLVEKMVGLFLAIFTGPFYFLYLKYNINYCRKHVIKDDLIPTSSSSNSNFRKMDNSMVFNNTNDIIKNIGVKSTNRMTVEENLYKKNINNSNKITVGETQNINRRNSNNSNKIMISENLHKNDNTILDNIYRNKNLSDKNKNINSSNRNVNSYRNKTL